MKRPVAFVMAVTLVGFLALSVSPPRSFAASYIGPSPTGATSGSAWIALKGKADQSAGTANLCSQESRQHPGVTLAAAIVYARTRNVGYQTKAITGIKAAVPTIRYGCYNSILSLGRQLGAYVLAADYAEYRDPGFVAWVSAIRTKELGSHSRWHQLRFTAGNSANNWGTFALASMTVADAYLRDWTGLARDLAIFKGYGDGSWTGFVNTNSNTINWYCAPLRHEIGAASCSDPRKRDAAVQDAARTTFPYIGLYPAEAAQGYVVTAEILYKAGYTNAWTLNNAQLCRNAKWRERMTNGSGKKSLNWSSADYYVTYITNKRCGFSQPTVGAPYGRIFGFTDWLYQ